MTLLVASDMLIIAVSYFFSFWLRIDVLENTSHLVYGNQYILFTLPWLIGIRIVCGCIFRLYHWSFSHAGQSELVDLIVATALGTILFAGLGHGLHLFSYPPPRSIYVLEAALTLSGMVMLRFFPGYLLVLSDQRLQGHKVGIGDTRRTLIYGNDKNTALLAQELLRTHGHGCSLLGFIDDNQAHWNSHIHGVKVLGGTEQLPQLLEEHRIDQILIADAGLSGQTLRHLVDICGPRQVKLKKTSLGSNKARSFSVTHALEHINPELLLDRHPVRFDAVDMGGLLRGKAVMVTGAGGTIGSELCRQVALHEVRQLIIFDINENALFFLDAELRDRYPGVDIQLVIGSIRDRSRLNAVMSEFRPHVIFHAAAHKHVPLLENAPGEALKNNVLGTYEVAQCALQHEVERFVFISTDKAVSSASVLGASKRLAELVVRQFNGKGKTIFSSVRFGNVLGSNGSLMEIVCRQIAKGGPVTVTHPQMSRYFMTIQEAAGLVLVSAAMGEGEINVLDMGEPINIDQLVRQIIFLHGLVPERDIEVIYTEPRPGEKMHEELYSDNEVLRHSSFPRINIVEDTVSLDIDAMLKDAQRTIAKQDEHMEQWFFQKWVRDYVAVRCVLS